MAGAVNRDLTLTKACSPYAQPYGGVDIVEGATLTIEAGVELRFMGSDWLEVGAAGKPGRLIAKGTPEEPIVFTSADPDPKQHWLGVWFHSGTLEGSVLSNVIVRRAGGLNRLARPNLLLGCVTLTGVERGALQISNLDLQDCINGGLRMTDSHARLSGISFSDMLVGLDVDALSAGQLTEPAAVRGVSHHAIRGGDVAADATWIAQSIPYVVQGDVRVAGEQHPVLTLKPGLELRFAKSAGLSVGGEAPGGLGAEGTADAPIRLTAAEADAGWKGVRLMSHTEPGTRLSFVRVEQATDGDAAISVHTEPGRVRIQDTSFDSNATDVLVGCGSKPALANNRYGAKAGLREQKPCK